MTHRSRNPPPIDAPSRREALAGLGVSVASWMLAGPAAAQSGAGLRILAARPGTASLRDDAPPTAIWGYDGRAPGPLTEARQGEEVAVRLANALPEPTAIHWRGVRLPNGMDGVPGLTQAAISPGAAFEYRFVARDAGTFLYHAPPAMAAQRRRGLAGALVVHEVRRPDVDHDVLLVLSDWQLAPGGALAEGTAAGALLVTANGQGARDIPVRRFDRLRLRLANASANRAISVRVDRHEAIVMAIDGQPAEPFAAREGRVALGPGNRADLFVDATLAPGETAAIVAETSAGATTIARLVYGGAAGRSARRGDPGPLPANGLPQRMDFGSALKLDVPLDPRADRSRLTTPGARAPGLSRPQDARAIWRAAADAHLGPPLFSVRRGRSVTLGLANPAAGLVSMHLHGHAFRLLDALDDGWKPFWLDTLPIGPGRAERIAFVADNPGKWLLSASDADGGDRAFGAWFEVT